MTHAMPNAMHYVHPHPTDETLVRISIRCCECKTIHQWDMSQDDWFTGLTNYANGALMQHAFSNLDADRREMLISRICPTCFDAICHD